jgi:hypothetical protein
MPTISKASLLHALTGGFTPRPPTRVELLPTFKFTGKTVKNSGFTDNYR